MRVDIKLSDGERTEISSGEITEGDTIITGMSSVPAREGGNNRGRFGRFL